jgi:serine/threonine-protein kinase
MLDSQMTYSVGERICDYQVVERIGAGGMGAVYKVRNLITDRLEAMKCPCRIRVRRAA